MSQNGNSTLWIKQIPTGPFSRLTFGDTANLRPTWSADGRSLVYIGNAGTNGGSLMSRRADGTGTAQLLARSPFAWAQVRETRDGKWVVGRRSFFEAGSGDIYAIRKGDSTVVPLVTSPATEVEPVSMARLSPSRIIEATMVAIAVFSARINCIRAWNGASTGRSTLTSAP